MVHRHSGPFYSEGDYRDVLAVEYGHDVDISLCFHSATAALTDDRQNEHGYLVAFEAVKARP